MGSVGRSLFIKTVKPIAGGPFRLIRRVNHGDFPQQSWGPVMNIDHFYMPQPVFPPHPHAGFIAATFLFEDSPGSIANRDSLTDGVKTFLEPGGVYWLNAGSGAMHEQINKVPGVEVRGLQVFIDLPAQHKLSPPSIQLIAPADVPTYTTDAGARVRVLAGPTIGSNIQSLADVAVLELTFPKAASSPSPSFQYTLPENHTSLMMHMLGGCMTVTLGSETSSTSLGPYDTASVILPPETKTVTFSPSYSHPDLASCDDQGAIPKVVVFSGPISGQRRMWAGPFCMETAEQVEDARKRFQAGEMGTLEPSDVSWIGR